jgi:hypothetical protein
MTTETTETKTETATTSLPLGADKVVNLVTQLGAGWARYGITIGRLALQQSARALETTSEILGEVAAKFEKVAKKDETDSVKH